MGHNNRYPVKREISERAVVRLGILADEIGRPA